MPKENETPAVKGLPNLGKPGSLFAVPGCSLTSLCTCRLRQRSLRLQKSQPARLRRMRMRMRPKRRMPPQSRGCQIWASHETC